jgi:hypothetical protein
MERYGGIGMVEWNNGVDVAAATGRREVAESWKSMKTSAGRGATIWLGTDLNFRRTGTKAERS